MWLSIKNYFILLTASLLDFSTLLTGYFLELSIDCPHINSYNYIQEIFLSNFFLEKLLLNNFIFYERMDLSFYFYYILKGSLFFSLFLITEISLLLHFIFLKFILGVYWYFMLVVLVSFFWKLFILNLWELVFVSMFVLLLGVLYIKFFYYVLFISDNGVSKFSFSISNFLLEVFTGFISFLLGLGQYSLLLVFLSVAYTICLFLMYSSYNFCIIYYYVI